MELGRCDFGMVERMQLGEPYMFPLVFQRDVGHGVGGGVVCLLNNIVGSVGERIRGGIIHIMYRRVDAADAAVENGLVAVHHAAFIAQEQNPLSVNGLYIEFIGER